MEINLPVPLNKPFEGLYDYDRGRYFWKDHVVIFSAAFNNLQYHSRR